MTPGSQLCVTAPHCLEISILAIWTHLAYLSGPFKGPGKEIAVTCHQSLLACALSHKPQYTDERCPCNLLHLFPPPGPGQKPPASPSLHRVYWTLELFMGSNGDESKSGRIKSTESYSKQRHDVKLMLFLTAHYRLADYQADLLLPAHCFHPSFPGMCCRKRTLG